MRIVYARIDFLILFFFHVNFEEFDLDAILNKNICQSIFE